MTDDLQRAWRDQTLDAPTLLPVRLRAEAQTFERSLARRNLREAAAGLVVMVAFAGVASTTPDAGERAGAVLLVLGTATVLLTLYRRGRPQPPESWAAPTLAWRRAELVRQRDLLAQVGWWYLGPLVPGMAVFLAAGLLRAQTLLQASIPAITALGCLVLFLAIGRMNRRAAQALNEEVRRLDEAEAAHAETDGPC